MANIVNLSTKQLEEVNDSDVNSLISSGTHGFLANEEISVLEGSSGTVGKLPANEAINEIKGGNYSYISDAEINQRRLEEKFGGIGQQAIGVAEQAASGLTLGLSEVAEVALGVPKSDIDDRNAATGYLGDAANIAGTISPITKLAQGVKLLKVAGAPVRAIDKLGMGAELSVKTLLDKSIKNKVIKRGLELGTRGAAEGALFNSANYLKESAIGDVSFNTEGLLLSGAEGAKFAGLAGAGLGAGSQIAAKAAGKVKSKLGKSLKKFSGVDDAEGGLRLNTKGRDLKQKDLGSDIGGKGSEFRIDENSGLYKYSDSTREVYIDPKNIKGKVLVLSDVDELHKLGAKLEIEDLPKKLEAWDESKEGFSEFLSTQRIGKLGEKADKIFSDSQGKIQELAGIGRKLSKLRKGYNRHRKVISDLQAQNQTPSVKAKIKNSRDKVATIQNNYKKLSDQKKALSRTEYDAVNFTKVDNDVKAALSGYNAIKIGKRVIVKNLDSVDDAIQSATTTIKTKMKKDAPSFGDIKTLNLSGAMKGYFKKKTPLQQKELAAFMRKNFRSEVNDKLINHPMLTDLDDLMVNVERSRVKAIEEMDSSINRMENILEENGLNSTITGTQIANAIDSKVFPQFYDKARGKPYPNLEKSADAVHEFSNNFRKFGKDVNTGADIPFSPSELRNLRIQMDNFPGIDFDKNQSLSRELVKTARREMEESLVREMGKFDDASGFVSKYKDAKKTYGHAMDANKILENRFSQESGNNAISLTGYIAAGTGAGIGGLPGAVAALGVRELGRAYGNNLLALYADRVFKAQGSLSNKITKSVKGFLGASSSTVVIAAVASRAPKMSLEDRYDAEIKDIDSGKYDFESFAEDFIDNNQGLTASMPETSNMLQEKIGASYAMLLEKVPSDPYQHSFIRKYRPADSAIRKFLRYKKAITDPNSILKEVESGSISNESIEVLERLYPAIYKVMQFEMMEELSINGDINYKKRAQINKLFKIQTDSYQRIDNVILLQELIKNERVQEEQKEGASKLKGDKKQMRSKSRMTTGQRMMDR